jgi:F0F1-type ATP synthase epsilon subunit
MKKKRSKQELFVTVLWSPSTEKSGYRGPAIAVSSENKVGKFDILPTHINFISLISNKLAVYTQNNKKVEYEFKRGVLEVSNNLVRVFLGI